MLRCAWCKHEDCCPYSYIYDEVPPCFAKGENYEIDVKKGIKRTAWAALPLLVKAMLLLCLIGGFTYGLAPITLLFATGVVGFDKVLEVLEDA